MTDLRALCARMADELDHYRQLLMGDRRETHALATEARAALEAQPEPQGPTDKELDELFTEIDQSGESESWRTYARAVLAQLGRLAIEPVPVSERLPGPEDCDAEGRCWWWNPTMDPDCPNWWSFESTEYIETEPYWLPHWALPVPGVEGADA